MITQSELQELLSLPLDERLRIAQRLIESALQETADRSKVEAEGADSAAHQSDQSPEPEPERAISFRSLEGLYSGGPSDTGERADEILRTEIKSGGGFTLKHELPT